MAEATDSLDLAAQDVSDAGWDDLVRIMMEDDLDITGFSLCGGSGGCACGCGCSCISSTCRTVPGCSTQSCDTCTTCTC
jgi:hypothetical protein